MAIIWRRKNPPATDERIAQFEAREQLVLPESYKVFLRRMNGGIVYDGYVPYYEPYRDLFFLTYISNLGGISQKIFRSRQEGTSWWERSWDSITTDMEERFPQGILPIGGSWSGREDLVLDLATGAIYLWFAEIEEIFAAPDMTTFVQEVVCSGPWIEEDDTGENVSDDIEE